MWPLSLSPLKRNEVDMLDEEMIHILSQSRMVQNVIMLLKCCKINTNELFLEFPV